MALEVVNIQKEELSLLMQDEAFKEGWLYSKYDVNFYYSYSQNFIYAVKKDVKLVGCVILHKSLSTFNQKPIYSAGFFIVLSQYRGQQTVGPYLWQQAITKNIEKDALVCFHSVPRATNFYQRLNFKKTNLIDLYFCLKPENLNLDIVNISLPVSQNLKIISKNFYKNINDYNNKLFAKDSGLGIKNFIVQWLKRPDALVVGYYENDELQGYGVATICKQLSQKESYRIAPLFANNVDIAKAILQNLIVHLNQKLFVQIELNSLATPETIFGNFLNTIGFMEKGKNFIVSNKPDLIKQNSPILQHIFSSIPLEYPHEVIANF